MPVERDVGRVEIEHHLLRSLRVRLQIEIHQQFVEGFGRVADLVMTLAAARQFEPVERALAGQRSRQVALARELREDRCAT